MDENTPFRFNPIEENPEIAQKLNKLMHNLNDGLLDRTKVPFSFHDFIFQLSRSPKLILRDSFQLFTDMVNHYVKKEKNEQKLGFRDYNTAGLFIKNTENPFFADNMFANYFMEFTKSMRKGIQTNRIFLFEGPPGSGKSTFLNNLLDKLEEYTRTPEGILLKTVWHLDLKKIRKFNVFEEKLKEIAEKSCDENLKNFLLSEEFRKAQEQTEFMELSCPYHDHPIIQIPIHYRKQFLDTIITDQNFKDRLFNDRQYDWVLKEEPCHICSSIYDSLYDVLQSPEEILPMIHGKIFNYSRKYGKGITVFNPGDSIMPNAIENTNIQSKLHQVFNNNNIRYVYSPMAYTNVGVMAIMDIKENNIIRLKNLHSTISDGINRVEMFEERIRTLFLGVINPEDKAHYSNIRSFQDRIITINIPYTLDYKTVVKIFKNKYGNKISEYFLPNVLNNFARIIVSTRLQETKGIKKWIKNPAHYKFADEKLHLIKMEIYTGVLPSWLSEDDKNNFTKKVRRQLLDDTTKEGLKGISGRQALNIFNSFYTQYATRQGKRITMDEVSSFFTEQNPDLQKLIPDKFLDALIRLYDYTVLQQLKESIYFYNTTQISKEIKNYLFAINYDSEQTVVSKYTQDKIQINEDYFKNFEAIFLGTVSTPKERKKFRENVQKEYISKTLAQEINIENKDISETQQFKYMFGRYTANLKENALAPYLNNDNFRRAVLDYGTKKFQTYDEKLKTDICRLTANLKRLFAYSKKGAKQICIYILDKNIARKY